MSTAGVAVVRLVDGPILAVLALGLIIGIAASAPLLRVNYAVFRRGERTPSD